MSANALEGPAFAAAFPAAFILFRFNQKHGIRQDSIAPGAVFFPAGDIRTIPGDIRTIPGDIRAGLFLHAFQAF